MGRWVGKRARPLRAVSGAAAMEPAPSSSWLRRLVDYFSIPAVAANWACAPQQQRCRIAHALGVPLQKQQGLSVLETRQAVHAWVDGQTPVPWDPLGQTTVSDVSDLAAMCAAGSSRESGCWGCL